MNRLSTFIIALLLTIVPVLQPSAIGQISPDAIASLNAKLIDAGKSGSSARKKLAIRRVIREAESMIKNHASAPNRFEALNILFRSQQVLVSLDNSRTNRRTFLDTAEQLAAAPNEYAAIRLNADLLLTQAAAARTGADSHARSNALRPLVERYLGTDVEAKVVRTAMIMALELGNTRLVNDLRKTIAERFPGDMETINFLRDKLAGQVFGAPFIGRLEGADGSVIQFPMDYVGTTTGFYFWSKDDDGLEDLKEFAEAWKAVLANPEVAARGRLRFVSVNVDDLPDAGESILRELDLDWLALRLPGGRNHPLYKTYCRHDPRVVTVSPTGYAAIFLSSGRSTRGYERNLQSWLARQWTKQRYNNYLQSIFAGEFLVMPTQGKFDPAAPPEWQAVAAPNDKPTHATGSVHADKLNAIQACFVDPPTRYNTPFGDMQANYEKADSLCREAIESHTSASNLWIVRNRRIVAQLGLWKLTGEYQHFATAVSEAKAAIEAGYPAGTDVVARFCLARELLRNGDVDSETVIRNFVEAGGTASAPTLAAAALLALDIADRPLHEEYRRMFLDQHADHPAMWTVTAYLLDRYHRYWMYHPPFVAGWTYGRRQGHFLGIGEPEDAKRTLQLELKTLDGETVRFPEDGDGKWTAVAFVASAEGNSYLSRAAAFVEARPMKDINLFTAVLSGDAAATRKALAEKKRPDTFPTLLVPGGMQNPIVRKLGILDADTKPNLLLLRPDGTIAIALSGLPMTYQKANLVQNTLEWHDEKNVDEALARGDIETAKRLAFTFAPIEEATPPGDKKKPQKIAVPHLRSRAKVYFAMGNLDAAYADAEQVYLAVNSKAGYLSMRTEELEMTVALKTEILDAIKQRESGK